MKRTFAVGDEVTVYDYPPEGGPKTWVPGTVTRYEPPFLCVAYEGAPGVVTEVHHESSYLRKKSKGHVPLFARASSRTASIRPPH